MQKILFLNLTAFSQNGGIEKFNRCFLKALLDISTDADVSSNSMSVYDDVADDRYYNKALYRGIKGRRFSFILKSIRAARLYDTIVIGHINIALAGVFIKRIFPKKKIILVTHGIEVWEPLRGFKGRLLQQADMILTVSSFTKKKLEQVQKISDSKIVVFPNTIDPFFTIPAHFKTDTQLRKKYDISEDDALLYTLARVSSTEGYKGYDIVLECLPEILSKFPNVKYVIGGKYDSKEKNRIDRIIKDLGLENVVRLTGFIKDEDLVAHYQMADMFIMPSRKEGFGIVFIEAMVCGLPVMAGNIDGSVDALRNGELGTLVNPLDKAEITRQLCYFLEHRHLLTDGYKVMIQQKALQNFGFDSFKSRLKNILAVS